MYYRYIFIYCNLVPKSYDVTVYHVIALFSLILHFFIACLLLILEYLAAVRNKAVFMVKITIFLNFTRFLNFFHSAVIVHKHSPDI